MLTIILIVLGVIFLLSCIVGIIRTRANWILSSSAFKKLEINKTAEEYLDFLLEENQLYDVKVKKVGFWAYTFIGNTYSTRKKTIRISKFTAKRKNILCLSIACRLVAIAKMDAQGVKGLKTIELYRFTGWLPALFLPLVVIGLIIDLIVLKEIGLYTLVLGGVGLAIALFTFILACISSRKNARAYTEGEKMLKELGILSEEEERKINKLFKAWKQLLVLNVIYNLFASVFFLLGFSFSLIKVLGSR